MLRCHQLIPDVSVSVPESCVASQLFNSVACDRLGTVTAVPAHWLGVIRNNSLAFSLAPPPLPVYHCAAFALPEGTNLGRPSRCFPPTPTPAFESPRATRCQYGPFSAVQSAVTCSRGWNGGHQSMAALQICISRTLAFTPSSSTSSFLSHSTFKPSALLKIGSIEYNIIRKSLSCEYKWSIDLVFPHVRPGYDPPRPLRICPP